MIAFDTWLLFVIACVALAMTPGPNLIYLLGRTLAQGRVAGLVSLAGTSTGLAFHVVAAALGLSALLATVPLAYDAVRFGGAAYLVWLAWQTLRAPPPREATRIAPIGRFALWRDGAATGVLNPKVALFQLALFPQFIDPSSGSVLVQSLVLGATQLAIVATVDALFVVAASGVRHWFGVRPAWTRWSRRLLAGVFGALAARLLLDERR